MHARICMDNKTDSLYIICFFGLRLIHVRTCIYNHIAIMLTMHTPTYFIILLLPRNISYIQYACNAPCMH